MNRLAALIANGLGLIGGFRTVTDPLYFEASRPANQLARRSRNRRTVAQDKREAQKRRNKKRR